MEKGALELRRATTTKPRQIEYSGLFLMDHNGQTRVYRRVLGPTNVQLRRKPDSLMEEDAWPPLTELRLSSNNQRRTSEEVKNNNLFDIIQNEMINL